MSNFIINPYNFVAGSTLLNGLVSYYKSDTNGSFPDAHGSNNGTINGATYTASGKINGAYSYDGVNDYVEITSPTGLNFTDNFSIAFWFKPNTTSGSQDYAICKGNNDYAILREFVNNKIEFFADGYTGDNPRTQLATVISDTNFHHIGWTYNGSTLKGYLDGNEDVSVNLSFTLNTSANSLFLGASIVANNTNCVLDELGFWNRQLTASEVLELYNSGSGLQYPFT